MLNNREIYFLLLLVLVLLFVVKNYLDRRLDAYIRKRCPTILDGLRSLGLHENEMKSASLDMISDVMKNPKYGVQDKKLVKMVKSAKIATVTYFVYFLGVFFLFVVTFLIK